MHQVIRTVAGDVAVEPGLYRVGTGGIRIEDLVVVTPEGHRNLTTSEGLLHAAITTNDLKTGIH